MPTASAEAARAWLVRQDPEASDRALRQWLASSLNVEASVKTELRFPESGGYYAVAVGCDFDGLTHEKHREALAKVQGAMTPPTHEQAEEWIVALNAATARRSDDAAGLAVTLDLYAGTLRRWPADVAKRACMALALRQTKGPNWFPTLAELEAECARLGSPRSTMLAALLSWTPKTEALRKAEQLEEGARRLRIQAAEMRTGRGEVTPENAERLKERQEMYANAKAMEAEARELRKGARA